MTPSDTSDGPRDEPVLLCSWRLEGLGAATVTASGIVNAATAAQLGLSIAEALAHARLVLIDLHDASFVDPVGERVIVDAAARASHVGARLVVVGAPAEVQSVEVLDLTTRGLRQRPEHAEATEIDARIRPFDNPVNASVLTARVMSIAAQDLWFQGDDGSVGRAWAPPTEGFSVAPGTSVDIYLDDHGDVNGWWEPVSGLAVNQRLLDPLTAPETASIAACQGPCGVAWLAPAATRLTEHDERCLTCSGPLVLR